MRILIVEDECLTALHLQSLFEDCGHEIVGVCGTLSQARRYLSQPIDIAFLDIDLPDGKSFDFASSLQKRNVPFVFVSASQRPDVPAELRHVRFIAKPYAHAAIRACLSTEQSLAG